MFKFIDFSFKQREGFSGNLICKYTITSISVSTGRKLNVHKTFRRRPGRLLNVLCTFLFTSVSTGIVQIIIVLYLCCGTSRLCFSQSKILCISYLSYNRPMNGEYFNYAKTSHFDLYWFKATKNSDLH